MRDLVKKIKFKSKYTHLKEKISLCSLVMVSTNNFAADAIVTKAAKTVDEAFTAGTSAAGVIAYFCAIVSGCLLGYQFLKPNNGGQTTGKWGFFVATIIFFLVGTGLIFDITVSDFFSGSTASSRTPIKLK